MRGSLPAPSGRLSCADCALPWLGVHASASSSSCPTACRQATAAGPLACPATPQAGQCGDARAGGASTVSRGMRPHCTNTAAASRSDQVPLLVGRAGEWPALSASRSKLRAVRFCAATLQLDHMPEWEPEAEGHGEAALLAVAVSMPACATELHVLLASLAVVGKLLNGSGEEPTAAAVAHAVASPSGARRSSRWLSNSGKRGGAVTAHGLRV